MRPLLKRPENSSAAVQHRSLQHSTGHVQYSMTVLYGSLAVKCSPSEIRKCSRLPCSWTHSLFAQPQHIPPPCPLDSYIYSALPRPVKTFLFLFLHASLSASQSLRSSFHSFAFLLGLGISDSRLKVDPVRFHFTFSTFTCARYKIQSNRC